MVRIDLDREQAAMLHEVLENYLGDLRMEIAGTERKDFRDGLKQTEAFLKEVLGQLRVVH